jgi:hypothetical protein
MGIEFIETSAKDSVNVTEAFRAMCLLIKSSFTILPQPKSFSYKYSKSSLATNLNKSKNANLDQQNGPQLKFDCC